MTMRIGPKVPALVTGASSGIGEEFARQLASRGHAVTIVARREDRLEEIAAHLRAAHKVTVEPFVADLETAKGRDSVARLLRERSPWLLVNNAGFGSRGRLAELDPGRERAEVQVNVVAVQQLSLAVLPGLMSERDGGIINVASIAAFQPIPFMATYAATKAFVLYFTEALAEQLHGTGARAMALCPGLVDTEFADVAGTVDYHERSRLITMTPDRCVKDALHAFDRGSAVCIPGIVNEVLAQGSRLVPRGIVRKIAARVITSPGG